jgi:hypothetical protein
VKVVQASNSSTKIGCRKSSVTSMRSGVEDDRVKTF